MFQGVTANLSFSLDFVLCNYKTIGGVIKKEYDEKK